MTHFTSNTYQLKRKILNFANKISRKLTKPNRKFTANMTYGILASQSCLLTDTADHLHEPSKKVNVVDRLSRHLKKSTPPLAAKMDLLYRKVFYFTIFYIFVIFSLVFFNFYFIFTNISLLPYRK